MFCAQCGTENEEGAAFCKKCGQPLAVETKNEGEENGTNASDESTKRTKSAKKLSKKGIIAVASIILIFIVVLIIALNYKPTIHLEKYVKMEAIGYDGYGIVDVTIDWDAIEEKYGRKITYTKEAKDELFGLIELVSPIDTLKSGIKVDFSENGDLSNGDEVSYTWTIDESILNMLKCKVKVKNGTFKVDTLKEVGTFDPFEDITIVFDGIAPNGTAYYDYVGDQLSYYDFVCSQISGLSNGDVVTISLAETNMQYFLDCFGMIPSSLEKEYEVTGLKEYVDSFAKLPSDFVESLKSKAEEILYDEVGPSLIGTLSDLEYVDYAFLSSKDNKGKGNELYLIYQGTVTPYTNDDELRTVTGYFPIRIGNILCTEYTYDVYGWNRESYDNLLSCYIDIVEKNNEYYDAEVGDTFETYSDYEVISSLEEVSEEYKETIQADAESIIEQYIETKYSENTKTTDLKYVGEYLLVPKEEMMASDVKYAVVYSATVSNSRGAFDTTTVYYPVQYQGVVKLSNEQFMYAIPNGIIGYSSFPDSWYSTKGYTSETDMFSECINANFTNYTYEISDGLKEFEEK